MQTITVNASRKYNIYIGRDILTQSGKLIKPLTDAAKAVIVSDSNVAPLYLDTVKDSLAAADITVSEFVFPAGELSKSHETLINLYNYLASAEITRGDILIALGGGVTGDLTGFAAATYLRGIDYVQIPTSLLAQTDSSVGGKTAVDIKMGKNLVGAFKQPLCVVCDVNTLDTLPEKYFVDGMGEVVKYAMIKSRPLYDNLLNCNVRDILEEVIAQCITIKKNVVEADEFDKGERMLLNFGHTLGHSIEKNLNYTGITHGNAVAVGMYLMTELSQKNKDSDKGTLESLKLLLEKFGLDEKTDVPVQKLIEGCLVDKKRQKDNINIVICRKPGESYIKKMSVEEFVKYMEEMNV